MANHATQHKIAHNITTLCNIPLAFWLIYTIFTLRDAGYTQFAEYMAQPFNLVAGILLIICALKHFTLEIEVVFEDYISNLGLRNFVIIAMKLFFLVLGVTATIAMLKLGL